MRTHDFFTRIIAANCAGPNMDYPAGRTATEEATKVYYCGRCEKSHSSYSSAEECCLPEVYSEWECPVCSEGWGEKDEAEDCCKKLAASGQPMQCPVCLKTVDSFVEAADCCLHTHPTMTALGRWRAAEMVEGGLPWPDAVAANINH